VVIFVRNCVVDAVVNPNNKFEIYVDQSLIHSGSLLEDMTSVVATFMNIQPLSICLSICVTSTALQCPVLLALEL